MTREPVAPQPVSTDRDPIRVACAGDSLTKADVSTDYLAILRRRFAEPHYVFTNHGVNADHAYNLRMRLDPIIAEQPDVVTVLIGTNDARVTLSDKDLRAAVKTKRLRSHLHRSVLPTALRTPSGLPRIPATRTGHPLPHRPTTVRHRSPPALRAPTQLRQHIHPPRPPTDHRRPPPNHPRRHHNRRPHHRTPHRPPTMTVTAPFWPTNRFSTPVWAPAFHRLEDQAIHGQDARAMIAAAMATQRPDHDPHA